MRHAVRTAWCRSTGFSRTFDLETLEVKPKYPSSTPMAMRVPPRFIAILYGHAPRNLAATSGGTPATDVLKMLMAGADATMLLLGVDPARCPANRDDLTRPHRAPKNTKRTNPRWTQRQSQPEELSRAW